MPTSDSAPTSVLHATVRIRSPPIHAEAYQRDPMWLSRISITGQASSTFPVPRQHLQSIEPGVIRLISPPAPRWVQVDPQ